MYFDEFTEFIETRVWLYDFRPINTLEDTTSNISFM